MSEHELLSQLGRVLAGGGELAPTPDRVAGVRTQVEARAGVRMNGRGTDSSEPAPVSRLPQRRTARRVVALAAGIAATFLIGLGIGHEMPRPVRHVAHAVAPSFVESPELVDARAALDDLGRALSAEDADGICAADRRMLELVDRLSENEKGELVPVAHEVHERAVSFLAGFPCPAPG
jgi:hypothetical protein